MADVTISQLTQGTPSGSNLLPYSTGSNTLGVPISAIFQNTECVAIGTTTPLTFVRLHIQAPQESNVFQSTSVTQHQLNSHLNGNGANLYCGVEGSSTGRTDVADTLDNASFFGSRTAHATQFITNNSAKMTISTAGYVTAPYQAGFKATITQNPTSHNQTVIWNSVEYQTPDNSFNTTTGEWTVPQTGRYLVSIGLISGRNQTPGDWYVDLLVNGGTATGGRFYTSKAGTANVHAQVNGSGIFKLSSGDKIKAFLASEVGSVAVSSIHNLFCAELLG